MQDAISAEQWRPIPGYEGLYEVSDRGQVRSWHPYKGTPVPRTLKQTPGRGDYLTVGLSAAGKMRTLTVHTLVAAAFIGPRPKGLQTRHLDGDRQNNRPSNLRYGTSKQNAADRRMHGTHRNQGKTHCPRGHAYDESNAYTWRGQRHCKTCRRARNRTWFAARRATKREEST